MQKRICLILVLLIGSLNTAVRAQTDTSATGGKKPREKKPKEKVSPLRNLKDTISTHYDFKWDKEVRKNAIRVNPVSAFVLIGNVDYERYISPLVSVNINGFFGSNRIYTDVSGRVYPTNFMTAGGILEFRFYPWKKALRGFYVAPYLQYHFYRLISTYEDSYDPLTQNASVSRHKAQIHMGAAGGVAGYQWILGNWFAINIFAGAGYNYYQWNTMGSPQDRFTTKSLGVIPYDIRGGVSIGIAIK